MTAARMDTGPEAPREVVGPRPRERTLFIAADGAKQYRAFDPNMPHVFVFPLHFPQSFVRGELMRPSTRERRYKFSGFEDGCAIYREIE